jgi:NAD(P)-dependent dehydrogenase (short-subunit alcohol dehydrogenase family)
MPNRYSESYTTPQGPGDARPTAMQIIHDEDMAHKLSDKVVLITGCSSGIGIPTAHAMAATGAHCFLTARNLPKARAALSSILKPGRVELLEMDQTSLASVRKAAKEFLERGGGKLNILICNAAIMAVPTVERTADGFESQFGTNHLAHFLLFNLLADAMVASSTPEFNSRVVMVSSSGHRAAEPQYGNYDFADPTGMPYSGRVGYGQSKTANIYMANYIDRVYGSRPGGGIHATSLMPGGIFTGLQVHWTEAYRKQIMENPEVQKGVRSPEQGAATTVWAAVGREWEGRGGVYLEDCDVSPAFEEGSNSNKGYAEHAYNPQGEERLWKDSAAMVGL